MQQFWHQSAVVIPFKIGNAEKYDNSPILGQITNVVGTRSSMECVGICLRSACSGADVESSSGINGVCLNNKFNCSLASEHGAIHITLTSGQEYWSVINETVNHASVTATTTVTTTAAVTMAATPPTAGTLTTAAATATTEIPTTLAASTPVATVTTEIPTTAAATTTAATTPTEIPTTAAATTTTEILLYIRYGKMFSHKQRIFLRNLNPLKNLLLMS